MEYTLSFIAGLIAMLFIVSSYFLKNKKAYLLFQGIGIVFLILSYFFIFQFFAMLGLAVGLLRCLVYFLYEERGKSAPILFAVCFSVMTVAVYLIVNVGVQKTNKPEDILYLSALIGYAFTFRIRNLKIMRLTTLIPNALSIIYGIVISATPFVIVSYAFELGANALAIWKDRDKKQTNENNIKEQ